MYTISFQTKRLFPKRRSMRKTLLKDYPSNQKTTITEDHNAGDKLTDLVHDMKAALQEASTDLLQPRPEAVARLLQKVLH